MEAPRNFLRILELSGQVYLGLRVASGKGIQSFIRLMGPQERKGWILMEQGIEEWNILGFSEIEGNLYLYGPPFESMPEPFISLLDTPLGSTLPPRLILFVRRLYSLAQASRVPEKLYPEGIFFLKDGRVLILPEQIMQRVLALEPLEQRIAYFESFNHPDLTGQQNCSFFLGAITYRLITGANPYQGTTELSLHTAMRQLPPLPASLQRPGLNEELSEFLHLVLVEKEKPTLAEWVQRIETFSKLPLLSHLTTEEREKKSKEAERFLSERNRTYRRKIFWVRHKTQVILAIFLSLVIGYFAYDVFSNILRPPRTLGLTPEQVVRLFYSSMNTLDHQAMEDCVKGKVGKAYIDEVTQLYVVSRMRMSVEFKSGMVDAETWYRNGHPPIKEGETLYGIAALEVEHEVEQDPKEEDPMKGKSTGPFRFVVRFHRWIPTSPSEGGVRFKGFKIHERVTMQKEGKRWIIGEIQRLHSEPLPPPSVE
ncbi:MAG: hypothetical protein N2442_07290 [Spirochaetes bacterium]|nr:hypothetical protein [Spirochaetota bacterium]